MIRGRAVVECSIVQAAAQADFVAIIATLHYLEKRPGGSHGACHVHGRNAAQRGFHPTRKLTTGWFKVPPAVALSPAVPFCTLDSAGMKPLLGRDSSVNVRGSSGQQP